MEHIITEGTIDEKILKSLKEKDLTQTVLIEAVKVNLGTVDHGCLLFGQEWR